MFAVLYRFDLCQTTAHQLVKLTDRALTSRARKLNGALSSRTLVCGGQVVLWLVAFGDESEARAAVVELGHASEEVVTSRFAGTSTASVGRVHARRPSWGVEVESSVSDGHVATVRMSPVGPCDWDELELFAIAVG